MPGSTTSNFHYTYVLRSLKDGQKYMGYTSDLFKRIKEHNTGRVFSTSFRRPCQLIYYEACLSEEDAKRRETYLKTTGGRRFLAKRLRIYLFR
ncbi:MAG: GIY-YIG nuclease family protein [Candidatus Sungbacteria bacterium]|nr:GIY-YIG nuclease family protein [Candidatus Sungbacteria bacterium]